MPGLYIHIPFCQRKCSYCDFYSSTDTSQTHRFLHALSIEIRLCSDQISAGPYSTLYLGGGTPSVLSVSELKFLANKIKNHFHFPENPEWSIEINPGMISPEQLRALLQAGFNRLSIGAQSFLDHELRLLERIHGAGDIHKTVEAARTAGYVNTSLDLIYGLPGQAMQHWEISIDQCLDIEPEHISMYALTWSRHTALGRAIMQGGLPVPDEDLVSDMFLQAHDRLTDAGYVHYEISNYAKPDHECRHNQQYWDGSAYLGLGPSAHSHWSRKRWWNIRSVGQYCEKLEAGEIPVEETECLSQEEIKTERIALALRTSRGMATTDIDHEELGTLIKQGLGTIQGDRWVPSPKGMLLADEIALRLL